MQENKLLLIVDLSILLHANYYVCRRWSEDVDVATLHKQMLFQLSSLVAKFDAFAIVLCADSGRSWRRALLPSYKASRSHEQSMLDLFDAVTTKLENDYFLIGYDSVEADDIGYLIADSYPHDALLISGDADWQLMMNETTKFYHTRTKTVSSYEQKEVQYETFMKIARGCPTDEIPALLPKGTRTDVYKAIYSKWCEYAGYNAIEHIKQAINYISEERIAANKKGFAVSEETIQRNINLATYDKEIYIACLGEAVYNDVMNTILTELASIY